MRTSNVKLPLSGDINLPKLECSTVIFKVNGEKYIDIKNGYICPVVYLTHPLYELVMSKTKCSLFHDLADIEIPLPKCSGDI